ncbi:hypothetical protein SynBIOSE41_01249 [Synechococcus sp. BIOS-E4-1]|nr:hypothetical protein SynBIOSE41_01249 [Synechococcus sp. BIOS-E4-1]
MSRHPANLQPVFPALLIQQIEAMGHHIDESTRCGKRMLREAIT